MKRSQPTIIFESPASRLCSDGSDVCLVPDQRTSEPDLRPCRLTRVWSSSAGGQDWSPQID